MNLAIDNVSILKNSLDPVDFHSAIFPFEDLIPEVNNLEFILFRQEAQKFIRNE